MAESRFRIFFASADPDAKTAESYYYAIIVSDHNETKGRWTRRAHIRAHTSAEAQKFKIKKKYSGSRIWYSDWLKIVKNDFKLGTMLVINYVHNIFGVKKPKIKVIHLPNLYFNF